ncbi:MAG TPA: magnesium/cobalt transporter CorA [Candidatus Altiarchaeales archaeon]|nr:magnesium/cobalt transporter CorA [Candidatus Altiarchaeales archaeon]
MQSLKLSIKRGKKLKRSAKTGLPPGSLVHVGDKKADRVLMRAIDYDRDSISEREVKRVEECLPLKDTSTVSWINVDGLHDTGVIEKLGGCFGLHPLLLEDILNTNQRPKLEDFGEYIFIVLKLLSYNRERREISSEQVSMILGGNFLLTFQETSGDCFDIVRQRIRSAKGMIRKSGPDYLAYALIDAIVDGYFNMLEVLGEDIEEVEDELVKNPGHGTLQSIHKIRRQTIALRKSVWPLREVVNSLQRDGSMLVKKPTLIYLRDVYDHTIQVIDNIETSRDIVSGMLDIYLSSLSNRLNEVMKTLTIIATIFIPLTFITGVYGMNFEHMPELGLRWSYPAVWLVMISMALVMLAYFKKQKWM